MSTLLALQYSVIHYTTFLTFTLFQQTKLEEDLESKNLLHEIADLKCILQGSVLQKFKDKYIQVVLILYTVFQQQ